MDKSAVDLVITSAELVSEAKKQIENLTPQQVNEELTNGKATLIDIREGEELRQLGKINGAVHAPRGMIEFMADPASSVYNSEFQTDKRIIFYCAGGFRSALAAKILKEMGYVRVAHLEGGFKAWNEAGFPVINSSN